MRPATGVLGMALAFAAASSIALAAPAPPGAPPVVWRLTVLPNGLKVLSAPDAARTDVSVQVWYDVGARDDPPGRSGLAHLVEHLMFKATRDMPAEYIDQLTEEAGGVGNASTDVDFTEFHETVPAAHLQPILWAEAQRMAGLELRPGDLAAERAVVEQELKENVLDDPYGRLFLFDIPAASFAAPGYRRPAVGSLPDLRAATLADVQSFHARWYRPDNATLVVAGRFEPEELAAWVGKYFGALARPAAPLQRPLAAEPPRTGARTVDAWQGDPPDPAVVLSYAAPRAASPDAPALTVLNAILGGDDGSRAWRALVAGGALASDTFSDLELHRNAGVFYVGAIVAEGGRPAQVEAALRRLVERARAAPPTAREMRTAKTQLLLASLKQRETLQGLGAELGQAALVERDPGRINADPSAIQAVTAADVQRAARTYLVDTRRVTIRYHAASHRGPAAPDAASAAVAATATAAAQTAAPEAPAIAAAIVPQAPPAARSRRAAGGADAHLPRPQERTLANGLRVVVAPSGRVPLATAVLAVGGGALLDPPRKAGLTQLGADLWLAGSADGSAAQLAATLERLGLEAESAVDAEVSRVSIHGLSASLPQALALMAQATRRPRLTAAAMRQARADMADEVVSDGLDADALADMAVDLLVYGRLAGAADAADPRSFMRITRTDVLRQQARLFRPDNAVLVLTGDVQPQAAFAMAQRAFGGWRNPPAPAAVARRTAGPAPHGRVLLIDLPDAPLAEVVVAGPAAGRSDPGRYAAELANSAFGGTYTSRLNQEIRVRRGLTYDVASSLEQRRQGGMFQARAETQAASAGEVAALMLAQLDDLASQGVSERELALRKALLLGDLNRAAETSEDLADLLAHEALYGRPSDELAQYPARLAAVSGRAVQAAAARLADPSKLSVVVVADARRLAGDLRRRFPHLTVVTPAELEREAAR